MKVKRYVSFLGERYGMKADGLGIKGSNSGIEEGEGAYTRAR